MSRMRENIGRVGAIAAGAGAAGIGATVKAFADFDGAMTNSMSIMSDVGPAMEKQLADTAREVATSTTASHKEAADSFYFLASAGLSAQESLKAMPQVAAFAQAGALDMATATDYATDVMSAFGMEVSELGRVTDTMTGTVVRHNTNVDQMGQSLAYVAPVAAGLGVSIEETSAAIGFMSDVGIKGSKAGTALRSALASLSSPTGEAAKTLKKLGVNTLDAQGNMRPLPAILGDLNSAGITTADAMKIFGREAGPGMLALLKQGEQGLRSEAAALREMKGITQEVAQKQLKTLNAQFDIFKSKVIDAAIATGARFAPAATKLLGLLSKGVDSFTRMNNASGGLVGALTLIGTVVGGLTVSLAAFWPVISAAAGTITGSFIPAITGALAPVASLAGVIGLLTNPITIAIGLAAAFALAYKTNFLGTADLVNGAIVRIRSTIGSFVAWARGVWSQIAGTASTQFSIVRRQFEQTFGVLQARYGPPIQRFIGQVQAGLTRLRAFFAPIKAAIADAFGIYATTAIRNFITVIKTTITVVGQVVSGVLALIRGDWSVAWSFFSNAAQTAVDGVRTILTRSLAAWGAIVARLKPVLLNAARTAFSALKTAAITGVTAAWNWVKGPGVALGKAALIQLGRLAIAAFTFTKETLIPKIQSAITGAWNWVKGPGVALGKAALSQLGRLAIAAFTFTKETLIPKITAAITGAWNWVKGPGVALGKAALTFLGTQAIAAFGAIFGGGGGGGGGGGLVSKIADGLGAAWTWVRTKGVALGKQALTFLAQQAVTGLNTLGQLATTIVTQAINAISNYLRTRALSDIKTAFTLIGRGIRTVLLTIFNIGTGIGKIVKDGIGAIATYLRTQALTDLKTGATLAFEGAVAAAKAVFSIAGTLGSAIKDGIGAVATYLRTQAASDLKAAAELLFDGAVVAAEAVFNITTGIGGIIKDLIGAVVSYLKGPAYGDLKAAGEFLFEAVMAAAEGLYEGLIGGSLIPDMMNEIADFIRTFDLAAAAQAMLDLVFAAFEQFVADTISAIQTFASDLVSEFTTLKDRAVDQATQLKDTALERFEQLKTDAISKAQQLRDDVVGKFTELKDQGVERATQLKDTALERFEKLKTDAVSKAQKLRDDVVTKFTELKDKAVEKVKEMAGTVMDYMTGKKGRLGNIKSAGEGLVNDFVSGIKGKIQKVKDAAGKVAKAARDKLPGSDAESGPLSDLSQTGPTIPRMMADGIKSELRQVERASTRLAAAASPTVESNFGASTTAPVADRRRQGSDRVDVRLSVEGDDELARIIRENATVVVDEHREVDNRAIGRGRRT